MDYIVIIVIVAVGLLVLYLRTVVKSTVEKSINHQFNVKLKEFEQNFTKELHSLDRKDKYQLAALDKRLESHQLAYSICNKLLEVVDSFDENLNIKASEDFKKFWNENCLYLTNKSREAVFNAYSQYRKFRIYYRDKNSELYRESLKSGELQEISKSMIDGFNNVLNVLVKSVDLDAQANEINFKALNTKDYKFQTEEENGKKKVKK